MNKKHTLNLLAFALISFFSLSAMEDLNAQLLQAALNGHTETVNDLLDRGAIIDTQNKKGSTALQWAALNGRTETVKDLLDRGANVDTQNKDGTTALLQAALNGHTETVNDLLDRGAIIDTQDKYGKTAYDLASLEIKKIIQTHAETKITAFAEECNNESSYLAQLQPTLLPDIIAQMIKPQGLQQKSNSNDNTNDNS